MPDKMLFSRYNLKAWIQNMKLISQNIPKPKIIKAILILLLLILPLFSTKTGIAQESVPTDPFRITLNKGEYGYFPYFELEPVGGGKGKVIDLSGWDVGGNFSEIKLKNIRETIDAAYRIGFNIVYIRVDWQSIEPFEHDLVKGVIGKLTEIMDEIARRNSQKEEKHKVRVIIALELDCPPKWFTENHPTSEMIHINPFNETYGPMGPVRNANLASAHLGYGVLNDADYQKSAKKVIRDIVFELRNHPALFGWALTSPSSPLWYPGAGKDGVGGFADYSMNTSSLFTKLYGVEEDNKPLARLSQGQPDLRPGWTLWMKFRREIRRQAVDDLGKQIFENDLNHPIFVLFWGLMGYEGDNGYRSQVWCNDYYYQLTRDYVNGVLIPFQLSSKTFKYPSGNDDMDSLHQLVSSVELAQRYGKVPLLMVEKSWRNPPTINDIKDLAHLAVALGADIIWSHKGMSELCSPWTASERASIERVSHLIHCPPPLKPLKSQIAVLDYPSELSKFYCEKDNELEQSLAVLDVLQDAGYHYWTITPEEYNQNPDWLKDILIIAPLAGNMGQYLPQKVQEFINRLRSDGKDYLILQPSQIDAFIFNNYDDDFIRREIHDRFGSKGISRHWLYGNKCFIVVNWPYIFIKINQFESPDLKIHMDLMGGETLFSGGGTIPFLDIYNDRDFKNPLKLNCIEKDMEFPVPGSRRDTFLLVWSPRTMDLIPTITSHRNDVDQKHRIASMKRSLPIALILTAIVITIGTLFFAQIYHPHIAKKKKRRKPPPTLSEHEDYFKP